MSEHKATISWKRSTSDFVYETYDRTHSVAFEGGIKIAASSAPAYAGKAEFANPEEMLASALSSCHMLTFLAVACKSGFTLDSYEDQATALLEKNDKGKMAVTKVMLRPKAVFGGDKKPDPAKLQELHAKAHANCMIANSVLCQTVIESQI